MKNIILILVLFTTLITGCDRDTLNGLNLKINAEVKSDYEEEKSSTQENNQTQVEAKKETATPESEAETEPSKKVIEVRETDNPDAPLAFKDIQECSEADIIAKTNEKFYGNNAQLKSVDSKNEEQVKQWKKIYQEVEKSCN